MGGGFDGSSVQEGKDVSIFALGMMVKEALVAAETLRVDGIDAVDTCRANAASGC